ERKRVMRPTTALLVGIGLAACLSRGAEAQSLYGPGGLVLHPAATVPPKGQLTPAVLLLPQHVRFPGAIKTRTWISGSLDYGLAGRLMAIAEGRPPGTGDLGTPVAVSLAYQYSRAGRLVVTWANNGMSSSPRFGVGVGLGIGAQR